MCSRVKPALLVVFVASLAHAQAVHRSVTGQALTVDLDAAPVPNLTYQLDCLAKLMPCSTDAYRALWKTLGWSDDDEQALQRWAELHQRYGGSIRLRDERRGELGYPLDPRGPNVAARLRHAGLIATDLTSFRANLGLLVTPGDADAATRVLERFWPRFEKWWKRKALKQLAPFLQATAALLTRHEVLGLIERAAVFYEADLPPGFQLPLHLMLRPGGEGATHGQQLEHHALVEVREGEPPEERIDVVAHELFHYLLASRSTTKAAALVKAFIDAPAPDSLMALGLLNESVATALGNGLVARQVLPPERFAARLQKPNSLYDDAAIDADAKHLLVPLEQLLRDGKTIAGPEFVAAQVEAARAGGVTPSSWLRTLQLFFDPEFADVVEPLRRAVLSNSMWSSSPLAHPQSLASFNESPLLSGVVLVSPTRLAHLASWPLEQKTRDALVAGAARGAPFIYAVKRGPKAWLWVLVAPDAAAMTALVERLPCAPAPVEGVVSTTSCTPR